MSIINTKKRTIGVRDVFVDVKDSSIILQRDPTIYDSAEIGTIVTNKETGESFILQEIDKGFFYWNKINTGPSSGLNTLTANAGVATVLANNINVLGDGANISTSGSIDTLNINLSATPIIDSITVNTLPAIATTQTGIYFNSGINGVNTGIQISDNYDLFLGWGVGFDGVTNGQNIVLAANNPNYLPSFTSVTDNIVIGNNTYTGSGISDTNNNIVIGSSTYNNVVTSENNILIGDLSSGGISNINDNIYIGNAIAVTNGEANTLRIGDVTNINETFIAGIAGITTSNTNIVTIDTSTNQLGSTSSYPFNTITVGDKSVVPAGSPSITATTGDIDINSGDLSFAGDSTPTSGKIIINGNRVLSKISRNIFLGGGGNFTLSGNDNVAFGEIDVLGSLTTGSGNIGIGTYVLNAATNGSFNIGIGLQNTHLLVSGINNVSLGNGNGVLYTGGESFNIIIGALINGVTGESRVTRIGAPTQTQCFIGGITGVATSNSEMVTIDTTTGQLGSSASISPESIAVNTLPVIATTQTGIYFNSGINGANTGMQISDNYDLFLGWGVGFDGVTNGQNIVLAANNPNYLPSFTSVTDNIVIGNNTYTGSGISDTNNNIVIGSSTYNNVVTSANNILIGDLSSAGISNINDNIYIGNAIAVTNGESNTLRIGDTTNINETFIAGISGVATSNTNIVTIDTSTNQLGSISSYPFNTITVGDKSAIPAGNPSVTATTGDIEIGSGNLSLAGDSTSTTGNILINGVRTLSKYANNLFIGDNGPAAYSATSGNNIGLGSSNSLSSLTTGSNNISIGNNSLTNLTTGIRNICLGAATLPNLITGNNNIILGISNGAAYTGSESNNCLIGQNSSGAAGESNVLRIASNPAYTTAIIQGISGVATAGGVAVLINSSGKLGTTTSSERYKDDIKNLPEENLEKISRLRPVSFTYKADNTKEYNLGLIAEEVHDIFPELIVYKDDKIETIRYQFLPILLLQKIQQLEKRIQFLESKE